MMNSIIKKLSGFMPKRSILISIVVSSIVSIIILIVSNFVIKGLSSNTMQAKVLQVNSRYIEYISNLIDGYIVNYGALISRYQNDEPVRIAYEGEFSDSITAISNVTRSISWNILESALLYDIVIYKEDASFVLHREGGVGMDHFTNTYIIDNYNLFDFENSPNGVMQYSVSTAKIKDEKAPKKVVIFSNVNKKYKVNIIVDYDKFLNFIHNSSFYTDNQLIIFAPNGKVLLSTINGVDLNRDELLKAKKININNKSYQVNNITTYHTGFGYSLLFSSDMVSKEVEAVTWYYNILNLIFIILGVFLFMYYRDTIYKPMQRLLKERVHPYSNMKSEFAELEYVLGDMERQRFELSQTLSSGESVIRQKYLNNLILYGTQIESDTIDRYFKRVKNSNIYLVELLKDWVVPKDVWNSECKDILKQLTSYDEIHTDVAVADEDIQVFVIYCNINWQELQGILGNILNSFNGDKLRYIMSISDKVNDLNQLPQSFKTINTIHKCRECSEEKVIFTRDDIILQRTFSALLPRYDAIIYDAILAGDFSMTMEYISHISPVRKNVSYRDAITSIEFLKSTIARIILQKDLRDDILTPQQMELVYGYSANIVNINFAINQLCGAISQIISAIGDNVIDDNNEIIRYIKGNFKNYVSLDMVAEHFNMNPSYISTYFKKKTGVTFSEYVNIQKVDWAKWALINTDMSISDIANELNFENPSSFIRFFKRMAGVTPGNFKKQL